MTQQGANFTWDEGAPAVDIDIPDVLFTVSADGDGGLNLRQGPGISYGSYGLIPKGTVLEVLNISKNYEDGEVWYQVRFDGAEGWVAGQYTLWIESKQ